MINNLYGVGIYNTASSERIQQLIDVASDEPNFVGMENVWDTKFHDVPSINEEDCFLARSTYTHQNGEQLMQYQILLKLQEKKFGTKYALYNCFKKITELFGGCIINQYGYYDTVIILKSKKGGLVFNSPKEISQLKKWGITNLKIDMQPLNLGNDDWRCLAKYFDYQLDTFLNAKNGKLKEHNLSGIVDVLNKENQKERNVFFAKVPQPTTKNKQKLSKKKEVKCLNSNNEKIQEITK